MDAAERFPGGPVALVFVLFWSPWMAAIGIPAGLILARHAGINPFVTFGLYALTDIMGAMITHPLYAVIKRYGGRVAFLSTIGRWYVRIAMIGAKPPRIDDVRNGPIWPALFRIGVVYTEEADRGNQNQATLDLAREAFNDYLNQYPGHHRNAEARKLIAGLGSRDLQRSFDIAEYYWKTKQFESAKVYYRDIIKRSPSGKLHDEARARLKELGE